MGFFKMYTRLLKEYPIRTNVTMSMALMSVGDAMAQKIEHNEEDDSVFASENNGNINAPHIDDKMADVDPVVLTPPVRRVVLRRYATHVVPQEYARGGSGNNKGGVVPAAAAPTTTAPSDRVTTTVRRVVARATASGDAWSEIARREYALTDKARVLTMMGWAGLFITPYYMALYRVLDRRFPHKNAKSIALRVVITALFSIPSNICFFAYGTCVHETIAWYALNYSDNRTDDADPTTTAEHRTYHPIDVRHMLQASRIKIQQELVETVERSIMVWIPINAVNFALVPSHLRPTILGGFAIFWNCYLSLVQHRDVDIPLDDDDATTDTDTLLK